MANVTSEDVQALTSAVRDLVDAVYEGLTALKEEIDGVKGGVYDVTRAIEDAAYGGIEHTGPLEKQAMELGRIANVLNADKK